jgi:hypothetical protein
MKIIDVPVFNGDGSIQYHQTLSANEVQVLLQFALNFLVAAGISTQQLMKQVEEAEEKQELND